MPPSPTTSQTAWRFCASCVVTLVCWAIWLVLGTTLVTLIYIAAAKELPVPDFVLRRAEAELAKANLAIRFGRARLDPTGKILFENVQLRSQPFEEPLLTCRVLYLRHNFWSMLSGRLIPDEILIEGAALQLPAMLSPTGTIEPLVRDLALVVRHRDNRWLLDQFTGRVGPLVVTARGELTPPSHQGGTAPLSPDAITARFLQVSRQLAPHLHQLDAFEQPALDLRFESPPGLGNTAHVLFTAQAAHQPWGQPLVLGPFAVGGSLRLDGREPRPLRLHLAALRAVYEETHAAEMVRAVLVTEIRPADFSVQPRGALVTAGSLTVAGIEAAGTLLRADLSRWPDLHATAALRLSGEFLAAEVDARLREESARIHAEGRADAALIGRVLERVTPRAASYFVFGDPVVFAADAELGPGWKFTHLASRVDARRLDSHGVKITAARGQIDIEGLSFLAHDARVELADNFARGSYWMDFSTSDYRMLLDGQLRPPVINGWFRGDWWLNFWNAHFLFPAAPPVANVDVSGRWRDATHTAYFGSTEARAATVWGGEFERTQALIFLRPGFTHALALDATRAGGTQRLTGTFRRSADADASDLGRFDFDFDGNLEPATLGHMLEGRADAVLASLQFTTPPQLHADGVLGPKTSYRFTGRAEGGLRYYGFPLDRAQVTGDVNDDNIRLDSIQFSAVGGAGSGKADLTGPPDARRLGFDAYLNGADLARTIRTVEQYQATLTGTKLVASESQFVKRAEGGRLSVAFSATGRPEDPVGFTGSGNASLTGTELGEIHLFGLLSQVLSGLSLNFSSLKLDAAHTSFRMEGGRLLFPDLKITGRSAVIDARGNFTFATKALDFTARLKPYEDNRNLLTAAIGIVINPITSILELKLNGPISKPNWSIVVGGSSSHPEAPAPTPKAPPSSAPPEGQTSTTPP